MSEPSWKDDPYLDASYEQPDELRDDVMPARSMDPGLVGDMFDEIRTAQADPGFAHPVPAPVVPVVDPGLLAMSRLETKDEYEAITDPAFTAARFEVGGDLEYVQLRHRDLFTQPIMTGTKWECVVAARSANSERAAAGKLPTEGHVIVRQRTVTYTSWVEIPEDEWDDAQVAL